MIWSALKFIGNFYRSVNINRHLTADNQTLSNGKLYCLSNERVEFIDLLTIFVQLFNIELEQFNNVRVINVSNMDIRRPTMMKKEIYQSEKVNWTQLTDEFRS